MRKLSDVSGPQADDDVACHEGTIQLGVDCVVSMGLDDVGPQGGRSVGQIGRADFARFRGRFARPKDFGHDQFISILQTRGQLV
jgi:hypothetical protein